jgi:hypothetical protein
VEKKAGLPVYSYSNADEKLDETLIGGFLNALESFIFEVGGAGGLQTIEYKGFIVYCAEGEYVKGFLLLTDRPEASLKQRLHSFIKTFEQRFSEKLEQFQQTMVMESLNTSEIETSVQKILSI